MACPRSSYGVYPLGTANILLIGAKYNFANYKLLYKLLNTVNCPIAGPNALQSSLKGRPRVFMLGFFGMCVDTGERCPGNPGPLAPTDLCGLRAAFLQQGLTFPW